MFKRQSAWVLAAGLIFSMPAAAESASLLEVMRQLGTRMGQINDGIWKEDYAAIADAAHYIAEHPKPPMKQRKKILGALGTDAIDFRAADKRVHDDALEVVEAARSEQMPAVVERYQRLVDGCVSCHGQFRERLRPVLHPE